MKNNPFKSLAEIYKKFVEKSDNIGLAEVYKQATELVFSALKEELNKYEPFEITITDVEYLDGYFIFGMGTNSVVHFHIKETAGWKYGIWWSPVEKSESTKEQPIYDQNKLRCSIFTQYEEEIDKFKPSASMVHTDFNIELDYKTISYGLYEFTRDIKFIHDEPYLAFYREMHYTDFNREYVSRAKAKSYFERHFRQKRREAEISALTDRELLKTVYDILKEDIDDGNCFIYDRGDCWHPRYEIIVKNTWEDVENGCYELFDLFEDSDAAELKKLWYDTVKRCEKRAKKADYSWYTCCHDSILLVAEDRFNTGFLDCNKIDINTLMGDM